MQLDETQTTQALPRLPQHVHLPDAHPRRGARLGKATTGVTLAKARDGSRAFFMIRQYGAFVREHEWIGRGCPISDLEVEVLYGPR